MFKRFITVLLVVMGCFSFMLAIAFPKPDFEGNVGVIKLNKVLELPFFKQFSEKKLLLYFGYTGCDTICTPNLAQIASLLRKKKHEEVGVLFFDLSPISEQNSAKLFAQSFHKHIQAFHVKEQKLQHLVEAFKVVQSPMQKDLRLNHSGFVYLVEKGKKSVLKRIYTTKPFDLEAIQTDLKNDL